MKNGMSMTTNVLVALAIAIIVLLVLVGMLMGIVPGASTALGCEADFRVQCNRFVVAGGCNEGSGLHIFDGCAGCSACTTTEDVGCKYVKCTVAQCAVGSCSSEAEVEAACCGETVSTTTTV